MNSLMNMDIFVPSRSRWDRSVTLEALQGVWPRGVALVVPKAQAAQYKPLAARHSVTLVPCPVDGIAGTRQFIGTLAKDKFLMLDDDLRFVRRRSFEDPKLYQPNKTDIPKMLLYVSRLLDDYTHAAIGPRQFNNTYSKEGSSPHRYPFYELGRPIRALAYRKHVFTGVKHGRVTIMEDFDVTLQLICQGYKNVILTEYAQDQAATQLPGGCSDYRTLQVHNENVKLMAKLHPGYTKIVTKKNISSAAVRGGLHERLELNILWQKCFDMTVEDLL